MPQGHTCGEIATLRHSNSELKIQLLPEHTTRKGKKREETEGTMAS
jgi:hypothetical protein